MKYKYEDKYLIYDRPKPGNIKQIIKRAFNVIDNLYYKCRLSFSNTHQKLTKKYKVSICAIFKDEAEYLKEWIEFHKIVGIEHFYLYNNNSSDGYLKVLQPYIDEGLVDLVDWPKPQSQMEAYADFMKNKSKDSQWVGFIDLDEYVVPNSTDSVYDFLNNFKNRAVVIVYWKCFGTSGYFDRDLNGLITEDFIVSWPKYVDIGKIFFNTDYEYTPDYKKNNYMHYMWAKSNGSMIPPVNVFDKVCTYGCNPMKSTELPIQINHYLIKSYSEYLDKKAKRGGGVHPVGMHDLGYFFEHEMKCSDTDYHAYKYLIKLKIAMKGSDT